MTEAIEKTEELTKSNLSDGKQKQRYAQALTDIKSSILFGYRKDLMLALTFADIKRHHLHKIAKKNFEEFAVEMGMGKTSAYRYVLIGERLREGVQKFRALDAPPEVLTQKDVFAAFDALVPMPKEIRLRDLAKASASYEEFSAYLTGAAKDEEVPLKLLESANRESVKRANETFRATTGEPYEERYHRTAEEHGFTSDKWGNYTHRDGTPLTPREECLFINPETALRPIVDMEAALVKALDATERSIKAFGEQFWKYRKHGNDEPFQHSWKAKLEQANKRLRQLEERFNDIYNGPREEEPS